MLRLWLSASLLFVCSPILGQIDSKPTNELLPIKFPSNEKILGFDSLPVFPVNNPQSQLKIELGRELFFDPMLSANGEVSCGSCHQPNHGFADSNKVAAGIDGKVGQRNVPTILNRGYGVHFSWDGRANSLEEQVRFPIENPNELGSSVREVLSKLRKNPSYVGKFQRAFNDEPKQEPEVVVTMDRLAKVIANFERSLVYGDSKVDRFRAKDYTAINKKARQGMWIFESKGGCWKCHNGDNLTDEEFHNTGVGFGNPKRDRGRQTQTGNDADLFKFKTPTLRAVELTAPYMHDGSVPTLKEVVEFYNRGGAVNDPLIDQDMKPLNLNPQEVEYLVEFLKALSQ